MNYSLRIQGDNRFRFWISTFTFLVSLLFVAETSPLKMFWSIILFLAYTGAYGLAHFLSKNKDLTSAANYALMGVDCAVITGFIHITGGIGSPLYFLYLIVFGVCLYHSDVPGFVYTSVLSFLLYGGLLAMRMKVDATTPLAIASQLILIGALIGVLHVLLMMIIKQRKDHDKLVSRAKTLAHVADVLSGSLSNSRDWIKTITSLIDEEVAKDGLTCRVSIHRNDQQFLPPSGGKLGVHMPIVVGDYLFGTLIVSRENQIPLSSEDQDFFSSVARSLGLSLHRAKLWEDFQSQLENIDTFIKVNKGYKKDLFEAVPKAPGEQSIENMLEMVRIERGKWVLHKEICKISAILRDEIEVLRAVATAKNVAIRVMGLETVPDFLADNLKLKRLVGNLLALSIKDSPAEKEVLIRLRNDEGDRVFVSIYRQGRGMTAEQVQQFFEKIEPAESELKPEPEQDLALAICKRIVDVHKGAMWVESAGVENGVTFVFTLPLEPVGLNELAS